MDSTISGPRCSVDDCMRPMKKRGYCGMHYQRVLKRGTPGGPGPERNPGRGCAVPGCGQPHVAHGYCGPHNHRSVRTGDPLGRNACLLASVSTHQPTRVASAGYGLACGTRAGTAGSTSTTRGGPCWPTGSRTSSAEDRSRTRLSLTTCAAPQHASTQHTWKSSRMTRTSDVASGTSTGTAWPTPANMGTPCQAITFMSDRAAAMNAANARERK